MLIQLVLGAMNLAVMAAVAIVIAMEKLLSNGEWLAKATGVMAIAAGAIIAGTSIQSNLTTKPEASRIRECAVNVTKTGDTTDSRT